MSHLILPAVLDLAAAQALKQDLLKAFAATEPVTIEAGQVQHVTSPCLQLLVAAAVKGACISNVSPAFGDVAGLLDLVMALKLEGPDA